MSTVRFLVFKKSLILKTAPLIRWKYSYWRVGLRECDSNVEQDTLVIFLLEVEIVEIVIIPADDFFIELNWSQILKKTPLMVGLTRTKIY